MKDAGNGDGAGEHTHKHVGVEVGMRISVRMVRCGGILVELPC